MGAAVDDIASRIHAMEEATLNRLITETSDPDLISQYTQETPILRLQLSSGEGSRF